MNIKAFLKRFGTDIAGYVCLVLVLLLGPLPGPGGVPLLLAGLGLLSIHNSWARRLLTYVKKHSQSLRVILFPENKSIQIMWDAAASVLFITSLAVVLVGNSWFIRAISTSICTLSVLILLNNRSRIDALISKMKR